MNGARQPQPGRQAADRRPATAPTMNDAGEHARDPPARVGRADVDHQSQRRDEKHRRPDAAECAENQQLPVGLGERARGGGQRDDQQTADVDPPLTQPLHQQAAYRGETQPASTKRR